MGTVHNLATISEERSENRVAPRRRVLIRAAIRLRGNEAIHPVTVKDISSTGLKAITELSFFVGSRVEIQLPNLGWVPGEVVRTDQTGCMGIRFGVVIDPAQTQVRITGNYSAPPSTIRFRPV